jgi:hypothetical protein
MLYCAAGTPFRCASGTVNKETEDWFLRICTNCISLLTLSLLILHATKQTIASRGDRDRNVQGDFRHRGVERGNFFEHGRRFGFRRFWHGQWVFLNGWDDCTAFVWVHVAPGVWAWRPIDVCIG